MEQKKITGANDTIEDLRLLADKILRLEEDHNNILDDISRVDSCRAELCNAFDDKVLAMEKKIMSVARNIDDRLTKAKRSTVLISLLGQKEELKALFQRIDNQPYEYYATSEWFKNQLR